MAGSFSKTRLKAARAWGAQSGTYYVAVDASQGTAGTYDLAIDCSKKMQCPGSLPIIDPLSPTPVTGDTPARRREAIPSRPNENNMRAATVTPPRPAGRIL